MEVPMTRRSIIAMYVYFNKIPYYWPNYINYRILQKRLTKDILPHNEENKPKLFTFKNPFQIIVILSGYFIRPTDL